MRKYRATPVDKPVDCGEFVKGWYKFHPYYEIPMIEFWEEVEQLKDHPPCGVWKSIEVHPSTVGQSTGFCYDDDKTDAYSGDICCRKDGEPTLEICWDKDEGKIYLQGLPDKTYKRYAGFIRVCKKLGTIHDK